MRLVEREMRKLHRTLDCVLITVLIFFVLVALDIVVVESIFRPSALWSEIWMWNIVFGTLVIVLPLMVAARMQTHLPLYIPILVAFGLEDTAFYSIQLKMPAYYVGISILGIWEPKRDAALVLNLLGVLVVVVIEMFYRASHLSRRASWKRLTGQLPKRIKTRLLGAIAKSNDGAVGGVREFRGDYICPAGRKSCSVDSRSTQRSQLRQRSWPCYQWGTLTKIQ